MGDRSKSTSRNQSDGTRFDNGVSLSGISYDKDLYIDDKSQYLDTAPMEGEEEDYDPMPAKRSLIGTYGPTKEMREEYTEEGAGPPSLDALMERQDARTIRGRESDYQRRGREARVLTPTRADAFTNESEGQSYKDIMAEREISREEARVYREIEEKRREGGGESDKENRAATPPAQPAPSGRKRRWDVKEEPKEPPTDEKPAKRSRWDQTPAADTTAPTKKSRWDIATPVQPSTSGFGETPI